jgi:hypothetical protein
MLGLAPVARADTVGPDYITSDNVEYIKAIKSPSGLTAGARIIGSHMYVTSSKDLEIFDISTPEDPQMVGSITANIQFENEEVPTNGKLLAISSDLLHASPDCFAAPPEGLPAFGGCLHLYDVRDPANVEQLPSVPGAGDHTSTCILDCSYFYGSAGTITDARTVFDPGGRAEIIGNWKDSVEAQGFEFRNSCHNVREVRPGIIITACQPAHVLSVLPQDGGSILDPKVLATASNDDDRFIHSARWPRAGADRFALLGGETNFNPQCSDENAKFMTFDASQALATGTMTGPLDEIRPINGSYLDSHPPAQILGCSVHWFQEHESFQDGGLVALAEYENGTRFLQIGSDGQITEQGFFIPLGGSASAPHWAPGSDIVYSIDYERGIDVLRWKGLHYVPGAPVETGRVAGTEGRQPAPAGPASPSSTPACVRASGFDSVDARSAGGGGRGVRFVASRRQSAPFAVEVFQVSARRRIMRSRRVRRFADRTGSFSWRARDARDGFYFARFVMPLPNGRRDVRYVTLRRDDGRFRRRGPFWLTADCAALEQFKLSNPVFGGSSRRHLGIAYRLTRGVDSVDIEALRGERVVKRFRNEDRSAGVKHRFRLPARLVPRGRDVTIRITIQRAGATEIETLTARRL